MVLPLLLLPILANPLANLVSTTPQPSLAREAACDAPCDDYSDRDHASLLVLVNKSDETQIGMQWAPNDMVAIPKDIMAPGARGELRAEAAEALERMLRTAKTQGHKIRVRSAFRSFRKQGRIFGNKAKRYGTSRASRVSARAGHSQHQLGTTIDIVLPRYRNRITQRIAKSPEWKWLSSNAHQFGFALSYPRGKEELTGYMYEPWHYRYLGREAATEMWRRKLPMESYLKACEVADADLLCGEPSRLAEQRAADG